MCGIAGIAAPASGFRAEWKPLLERMTGTLVHRGPDGEGFHVDSHAGLGHRRLSIIDLATGAQPLANEDGSVWVTFNGEIYNYLELARELTGHGHVFRTRSDTEVIVHAYEQWGEDCVQRFRGMFAFGVWDAPRRRLFLARDRLGKKPLYYAPMADGAIAFASELKALRCVPGVDLGIDLEALSDYLSLSYVPAPRTILRGVRKLRAGESLTAGAGGSSVRRYWDVRFGAGGVEPQPAERLRELLREAVSLRLRSDVPLGAFLSGGIDSTAIVGLMSGLVSEPVRTFCIGFSESGGDERAFARTVAARFGTEHHERAVGPESIEALADLVWHFDEPFADSSALPTHVVSRITRERVTVALSGDGGDESFAGYERYLHALLEDHVRSALPAGIRRAIVAPLARLYPHADAMPRWLRAKPFLTDVALPPWAAYFRLVSAVKPGDKESLLQGDVDRALAGYDSGLLFEELYARAGTDDVLSCLQYVDIHSYLAEGVLTKVDRASMAASLEVRSPLLDHEVVEYAASQPSALKLRAGESKVLLKQAVSDLLPPEIAGRAKRGFDMPVAAWLRGRPEPLVRHVLEDGNGLGDHFQRERVRALWQEHRSGARNHSAALWALLVFGLWHERHAREVAA